MKRVIAILSLVVLPIMIFAQTTGKVAGNVQSVDGVPLAGANVILEGTSMGAATDENGRFYILYVPAGRYDIRAGYIGYKTHKTENVRVSVGLTTNMDFNLEIAAVEGEAVTIIGQRRLIEPSATNSVRIVDIEEIQNAAIRSVTGMIDLQPGVVIQDGEIHIRGSREEEVGYTLDGADIKDVISSGRVISAIPEALSEIAIEAGGYSADIGGANAGVIRQTLRTGGNKLAGTFRFENGNYGYQDVTAILSGPIGPVRLFTAFRKNHADDWNPKFWEGFEIAEGELLPSFESGISPDGDEIAVVFDPDKGIVANWNDTYSFNGTALLDLGNMNIRLSGVYDYNNWMTNVLPIYSLFNSERLRESERTVLVVGGRVNYFFNPKFFITAGVNTVKRDFESYDNLFGKPGNFGDAIAWGDSTAVSDLTDASYWKNSYTSPTNYYVGQFGFSRPGDIRTTWNKSNRTTVGFDFKAVMQAGNHELKAGFERKDYTYRTYQLSAGAIYAVNMRVATDTLMTREMAVSGDNAIIDDLLSVNNRLGNIGYDDYANQIDDEWVGPRKPWVQSFYINDKYEAKDLVISVGVRIDQFNQDDWKMKDPTNPGWDETNQGIIPEEFEKSDIRTVVQPRLGLAFPISDKTVFHLQYGKTAQMVELDQPYASTRYMHLVWGGQNYTPAPMGFNLDPIVTTQYELGLSYEFMPDAAFDITAFAKNTVGQLHISKNREIDVNSFYHADIDAMYYVNSDFSTVNGVEFTLRTRRINRLQTFASYSWTDARGVNADATNNAGNLYQEALSPPPGMIMPLYYENKHRGAIVLDYRFGPRDGGPLLSNLGVNLQFKFNSGHPFTLSDGGMGQRGADEGALLLDARGREPQEPIGQSITPWNQLLNLKIDKTLNFGKFGVTLFAYVENLLNTKNVINVYSRSGNAYDDGFLTNPSLSSAIVEAQGDLYVELYENVNLANRQHWMNDFGGDVFGSPREYKFGASINF